MFWGYCIPKILNINKNFRFITVLSILRQCHVKQKQKQQCQIPFRHTEIRKLITESYPLNTRQKKNKLNLTYFNTAAHHPNHILQIREQRPKASKLLGEGRQLATAGRLEPLFQHSQHPRNPGLFLVVCFMFCCWLVWPLFLRRPRLLCFF